MTLKKQAKFIPSIKGQVARVLLDHAADNGAGQNRLTHRDIAEMLKTDWGKIHKCLWSLHEDGAIKIDRHRIIVELKSLQKAAGEAGYVQNRGG